jgi:hypothetical protein
MTFDDKETDTLRLNQPAKDHGLTFKRVRINYKLNAFNAHGLRRGLGYVEGFDRGEPSGNS